MKMTSKSTRYKTLATPVVSAVILLGMAISVQPVSASTSYDQGYNAGRNDALDGNPFNDYCPPNNPDLRCAIYKSAYAIGYAAAEVLHGSEEPRNDQDFSDRTDDD
jgi:hypothetical protein